MRGNNIMAILEIHNDNIGETLMPGHMNTECSVNVDETNVLRKKEYPTLFVRGGGGGDSNTLRRKIEDQTLFPSQAIDKCKQNIN